MIGGAFEFFFDYSGAKQAAERAFTDLRAAGIPAEATSSDGYFHADVLQVDWDDLNWYSGPSVFSMYEDVITLLDLRTGARRRG